jgi:ATP/maltotriose-dependent transcriptional regulator MalT
VGDIDAEEDALRRAYDLMIMMDDVARAVSIVAVRAGVAVTRGEPGAAVSLTEESERLAAPDDYDAQTRWRSARARAFALLGRGTEAQALARDAAEIAAGTDDINLRADALCDLAGVLEDRAEADAALETAISLYGQKGNLASQARAGSRSGRSRSPSGSDP